jgi:hypothetical protein
LRGAAKCWHSVTLPAGYWDWHGRSFNKPVWRIARGRRLSGRNRCSQDPVVADRWSCEQRHYPVLSEVVTREGQKALWQLVSVTISLVTVLLAALVLILTLLRRRL